MLLALFVLDICCMQHGMQLSLLDYFVDVVIWIHNVQLKINWKRLLFYFIKVKTLSLIIFMITLILVTDNVIKKNSAVLFWF